MNALPRTVLLHDVRDSLFRPVSPGGPARIGAELEVIPVAADGNRVPTVGGKGSFLKVLRPLAARSGWREGQSSKGTPVFGIPGGSSLTFEPGGQLEISLAPLRSVSDLLRKLEDLFASLERHSSEHGVELLAAGMDPRNSIDLVPLQFECERYRRMTDYFNAIGPAGVRMMRQTATLHVNLDLDGGTLKRWHVLNAMAPALLAMFANSPLYEGSATGYCSYRGETWRTLDWSRTGLADRGGDPAADYLDFALSARVMLLDAVDGEWLPFGAMWDSGSVTLDDWRVHLSTLFPEVRPRGYLELRSIDALPVALAVAPLVLLAGIAYDPTSLEQALEVVRSPRTALLHVAGDRGLADERLARAARDLVDIGLAGCRRLGPAVVDGADIERARDFFDRYTLRRRCPGDDQLRVAAEPVAQGAGR